MKKRAAPTRWHKLDNTANIFPVVASRRYSNVFRLTAVMREAVDPALLQQALEQTLPYFAAFNVRLRHGLFWNYLETNRATPQVLPEQDAPCRYIDPVETGRFLFRVLYYGSRVHLETFHVLTDGTGAMQFLKAVCYRYCQPTRTRSRPSSLPPPTAPRPRARCRTDTSSITFRPKAKRSASRARIICGASTASRAGWAWPRR